jgi:hypothetical protein
MGEIRNIIMNKRQLSMKAYWAKQTPEERSKRASIAATKKWQQMTPKERKEQLKKLNGNI